MLVLSQAPRGAVSARGYHLSSRTKFINASPLLFSKRKLKFISTPLSSTQPLNLTLAKADGGVDSGSAVKPSPSNSSSAPPSLEQPVLAGGDNVPLEGVIQFDKSSSSSRVDKWGRVALLAGGDVLALILFAAIGRYSHGLSVSDVETLRTADPFIAGWFFSAYFLGGYSEDGRGMNGMSKGVIAAAKSWSLGIPLGILIRAAKFGHLPKYDFILVTMASTAVLLLGCRALMYKILPANVDKKNDVYRQGNPLELFESEKVFPMIKNYFQRL